MESEGTWTQVPDAEYLVAPILCAPASRSSRQPTAEADVVAHEYVCLIMEENPYSDDDGRESWLRSNSAILFFVMLVTIIEHLFSLVLQYTL